VLYDSEDFGRLPLELQLTTKNVLHGGAWENMKNLEDGCLLHTHRRENLKSYMKNLV
jgi:hypothetical protein